VVLLVLWTAKRTNVSTIDEIGARLLLEKNDETVLSNFGYVIRGEVLEKDVMIGMRDGQRNGGRPRKWWLVI
jgi:hypothetical protein